MWMVLFIDVRTVKAKVKQTSRKKYQFLSKELFDELHRKLPRYRNLQIPFVRLIDIVARQMSIPTTW